MKIIAVSDSHGSVYNLRQILAKHADADKIIFMGDGERDFSYLEQEIAGRPIIMVAGNCDLGSDLNEFELDRIEDNLVVICHGHRFMVKYGDEMLIEKAQQLNAKLVLYGHTHTQKISYYDGMYVMNPGSVANYQYGLIDITKQGIVLREMDLLQR